MYIVSPRQLQIQRRVYLPQERVQVNGIGLGELEGFKIGKMFKRMIHFTPRSFQPKNIFGAIGSVVSNVATGGMASVISGKTFGAHSKVMKQVGMGVSAAGLAVGAVLAAPVLIPAIGSVTGAIGTGLTSIAGTIGGAVSSMGGGLASIGGGLLKTVMGVFGGGGKGSSAPEAYPSVFGGQQVEQPSQQVVQPYSQPSQQYFDPTAAYNQQVAASIGSPLGQSQLYPTMPGGGGSSGGSGAYPVAGPDMQLQEPQALMSPEDAERMGVQIDPRTGQVISRQIAQAGMLPNLSVTTWLVIGGVTLAGMYLMSDSKKEIGNA